MAQQTLASIAQQNPLQLLYSQVQGLKEQQITRKNHNPNHQSFNLVYLFLAVLVVWVMVFSGYLLLF
jgi:hypothetical protein